jgi:hypothetical protein
MAFDGRRGRGIGWALRAIGKRNDFGRLISARRASRFPRKQGRVPMRLPILLAVAALALAGCNANQTPNASARTAAASADDFNPIKYAQTSGFYAGR